MKSIFGNLGSSKTSHLPTPASSGGGTPVGPISPTHVSSPLNPRLPASQQYFHHNRIEFGHILEDGFRDAGYGVDPLSACITLDGCVVVIDKRQDVSFERFVDRCKKKLRKVKDEPTQAMVMGLLISDSCGRSGVHAADLSRRHTELVRLHRNPCNGELLIGNLLGDKDRDSKGKQQRSTKFPPTGAAHAPQRALLFKALSDCLGTLQCSLQRRPAASSSTSEVVWNVAQVGHFLCVVDLVFDPGALYEDNSPKAVAYLALLADPTATAAFSRGGTRAPVPPSCQKDLVGYMPRPAWHAEPWELEVCRGDRIGRGGFGEVFHARWEGIHVAVKEIKDSTPTDAEVVDFTLEISLLSQLNHPNIVRFWRGSFEMRAGARSLYMVTEYVKQGGLSRLLHGHGGPPLSEPLTLPQALSFALDVARGVQYLHTQKILHLDLKSPNVLCASGWTAKLCDFGLAKIRSDQTYLQSTLQGVSPVWAPPEMFDNTGGGLTEKADVYSFAIIFFELLTMKVPFSEIPPASLPELKLRGQMPRFPANMPEDCVALIKQCCAARLPSRPSMTGALGRLREIAQVRNIRLSEVKPPVDLLLVDGTNELWVLEAENVAAQKLVDLDVHRRQLHAELGELHKRLEAMRRRSHELSKAAEPAAAQRTTGIPEECSSRTSFAKPIRGAQNSDSWCAAFILEIPGAKFRCTLCSKLFRGPEFAWRHVLSKHQADAARITDDAYFDCDVSREDSLPLHRAFVGCVASSASLGDRGGGSSTVAAPAFVKGSRFSQALQEAAECGDARQISHVLALRADVGQQDDGGVGPLLLAAKGGHIEALGVLLAAAKDWVPLAGNAASTGVELLLLHETGAGLTPLHAAASEGHTEVVAALLHYRADVAASCARGKTPLLHAGENGHFHVCELLVAARSDVTTNTAEGETLLHVAARCGDETLISSIIAWRADLSAEDRDGWTPLHEAAHWGAAAVEAMLKARADVHVRSRDGETPLHVAMDGYEQAEACRALLEWAADPLAQDVDGETPLHVAVRHGRTDACQVLLSGSADVNAIDHSGRTPLDLATSDDLKYFLASVGATRGHVDEAVAN